MKRLISLTLVVAVALMAAAVSGMTPTHAEPAQFGGPSITINPLNGTENDTYTVTGFNFFPFEQIDIAFIDPVGNTFPFVAVADPNGNFQFALQPGAAFAGATAGTWAVQACDSFGNCDITTVTIRIAAPTRVPAPVPPVNPVSLPPAPQPARPTAPPQAGAGSLSITPGVGRQTDTFTVVGINFRPFTQFAVSLSDPFGNVFDYVADNGAPVVTADSSGNFVITFRPIIDFAGQAVTGQWVIVACEVGGFPPCPQATFTITP
jgi:hypothetical protein